MSRLNENHQTAVIALAGVLLFLAVLAAGSVGLVAVRMVSSRDVEPIQVIEASDEISSIAPTAHHQKLTEQNTTDTPSSNLYPTGLLRRQAKSQTEDPSAEQANDLGAHGSNDSSSRTIPAHAQVPEVLELPDLRGSVAGDVLLLDAPRDSEISNIRILGLSSLRFDDLALSRQGTLINIRNGQNFKTIGEFRASGDDLNFSWIAPESNLTGAEILMAAAIRWSIVQFDLDTQTHYCRLSNPISVASITLPSQLGDSLKTFAPDIKSLSFIGNVEVSDDDFFGTKILSEHSVTRLRRVQGIDADTPVEIVKSLISIEPQAGSFSVTGAIQFKPTARLLDDTVSDSWSSASEANIAEALKTLKESVPQIYNQRKRLESEIRILERQFSRNRSERLKRRIIELEESLAILQSKMEFAGRIHITYKLLLEAIEVLSSPEITRAVIASDLRESSSVDGVPEEIIRFPIVLIGYADLAEARNQIANGLAK